MMTDHSNRRKLLFASFLTLIAAGLGFGVRAGILPVWSKDFGFTMFELGTISGGGLVGFGVVILLASLITDRVGYKPLLVLAFVLHLLSAVITLGASPIFEMMGKDATYWCLYVAMFMFAIANGLCETVINPLVATVYPDQKTHYLNILHAGWPGGLVLGSLIGLLFIGDSAALATIPWEASMLIFLVPTLWYGIIVFKEKFPVSEASAAGLSFGQMAVAFASPVLLLLLLVHACVGYVELGTDSWITTITGSILADPTQGFLLFAWASIIMFVLRFFAGPIVHRINPLGLLAISAALGAIGLTLISTGEGTGFVWMAVSIYALGKTFLWPTMLGVVSERFPNGGALAIGAVGGVGMLSAGLLGGPGIGYKQDLFASEQLKAEAPATYERYAAADENKFLVFAPIKGLDGAKVGMVTDEGKQAEVAADVAKLKDSGITEHALISLEDWWETEGEPNAETDKGPVTDANIHGGRWALKYTAAVPAFMFVCYLLLLFYFRAKGGYKQDHVGGEDG